MQRCAGAEDGRKQIVGQAGVERDSTFDVSAEADFTLDDDQGAGLMLGEEIRGENNIIVGITFACRAPKESQTAAEVGENVANFRLKDHDQGKHYVGEHAADYPVQGCEFADPRKI